MTLPDPPTDSRRTIAHLIALTARQTHDLAEMCHMSGRYVIADRLETASADLARIAVEITASDNA